MHGASLSLSGVDGEECNTGLNDDIHPIGLVAGGERASA
jgi:hypothetical protein